MNSKFSYFPIIKEKENITKENNVENETNSENIINEFKNDKLIVLVCGKVQSGKTKFILDLINCAFNKFDYHLIIFLCGTTKDLKTQSINRINDFFNDQTEIYIKEKYESYLINKKILIPILKEKTNLENLYDQLSLNESKLIDKKILIIDDESDFASVNTNKITKEKTRINLLIEKIYTFITIGGMIQVTATPYANILNTKTDFSPKYIYTLKESKNYTGIKFFNSLDNFYLTENQLNKYIYESNFNDDEKVKWIKFSFFVWLHKTYEYLNQCKNEKSSFLIYTSDEKNEHDNCKNIVYELINNLIFVYKDEFENYLKKVSKKDKDIVNIISYWKNNINELKNSIHIINSDNENKINEINKQKFSIIIGGIKLSRGITYENLLTELFLYCSEYDVNADTLLQRCRWFGYRKSFKDNHDENPRYKYMNLVTKRIIQDWLKEAEKLNDILFENSGYKKDFVNVLNEIKEKEKQLNIRVTNERKK